MASDGEDDIEALRLAALATLKKKPTAEPEDVQPIPQLTSSSHSLHNSKSPWAEDFFESVPFHDDQPVPAAASFQPLPAPQEFGQGPGARFPAQNNWRGQRPSGNFSNNRFMRGRGPFLPNQRVPFGQNQRPPFGQQMQFMRNQRPPFVQNQRLPFDPTQPPPFGQRPMQFIGGPPRGVGAGGGGGNLIVINTVPEQGERPPGPRFPGPRPLFQRGGRGGSPGNMGRGGNVAEVGRDGGLPPVESSSKPVLLRPQDKYCPSSAPVNISAEAPKETVHKKKKDKFSRYNSSGSESDDESEDESEDEKPSRRHSLAGRDEEEKENIASDNEDHADQTLGGIPDTEISISAINTSLVDSSNETVAAEFDEPEVDNVGEEEAELDEEEEERLLASPSRNSDMESSPNPPTNHLLRVRQGSAENGETPTMDESPVRNVSPDHDGTPLRDECSDGDATPVRDESPERDQSPVEVKMPLHEVSYSKDRSLTSHQAEEDEKSGESDMESDSGSESGNESDTSSSESGSDSSSSVDGAASQSSGQSKEGSVESNTGAPEQGDSDSDAQCSGKNSDSRSEEEESVRCLPSRQRVSTSPKSRRSPSPKKASVSLTPEEKAKLEARRRKFESGKEVTVNEGGQTISLKGIVSRSKRPRPSHRQGDSAKSDHIQSSSRTVQARTSLPKLDASESHCKHSRRKVSLENQVVDKSGSNSDSIKSVSEDDEEEEEGGSRSWRREANTNVLRRGSAADRSLPGSAKHRDLTHRGGSRNGGLYRRRGFESSRESRPEIHYSSSDNEGQDSDRKLISVVVSRSSAGLQQKPGLPRDNRSGERTVLPNRKRTTEISGVKKSDRYGSSKKSKQSKHYKDISASSDSPGSISVVISGDRASSKKSDSASSRVPVHQRLGKGERQPRDSRRSRSKVQSESHTGEEGELEQRIRRIQKKNKAIMRRQEEVRQDRELYG